jgi:hypothetical protein
MVEIHEFDEKITPTGFLNNILEIFIKDLTYIKKVQNYFLEILDIIPYLLKIRDDDIISKKIIYNGTEFILLILSIVIINQYSHNNILKNNTPENIIFCIFIFLLILNLIHTTYLYLFKKDITGILNFISIFIYKIPLYLIVFVFSIIIYIIINIPNWTKVFFSGLNDLILAAFRKLKDMLRDPEETKILYKYGFLYLIIFIIIIILYYASFDPSALSTNAFKYIFMIAIPLIIVLYFVFPLSQSDSSYLKILLIAIVFSFFFALIYFYTKSNSATFQVVEYITIIIGIMMIITALSIIFYIMSNYFKSLLGWEGFITYFIFYIPCLFIDFVKYILNEFNSTSTPIIILLIFEIVLLILYIYLPLIIGKIKWTKNNVLLPNSAFLDIKQNISNSELNKAPKFMNDSLSKPVYNQNYSFSMWVYLNPQSQSFVGYSKESQIFNYGEGKPKISYYNDMTTLSNNFGSSGFDKFKIYFSNSTSPVAVYKFVMPSQKWNNIVVNFSSVKADLFVNGKLEKTYTYQGNTPSYDPIDFITIGDDQGLDGAVCNIVYYSQPLSLIEIASHYNILSLRNPPTF